MNITIGKSYQGGREEGVEETYAAQGNAHGLGSRRRETKSDHERGSDRAVDIERSHEDAAGGEFESRGEGRVNYFYAKGEERDVANERVEIVEQSNFVVWGQVGRTILQEF